MTWKKQEGKRWQNFDKADMQTTNMKLTKILDDVGSFCASDLGRTNFLSLSSLAIGFVCERRRWAVVKTNLELCGQKKMRTCVDRCW
jgi:hypothetical protein